MSELSTRKPLDYWVRVINDAVSELARSETRERSTLPLRVTLAAIAHHIESGAVMPTPPINPDALHCGCCGIELTPESETFFGEAPLCKSCGRAATIAFEEASRRLDIEVAARAFLAKLDECEPAMRDCAQIAAIHEMPYVGPNYATEKAALAAILAETTR